VLLQAIKEHSMITPASSEQASGEDAVLAGPKFKLSDRVPVFLRNCRQNVVAMADALDRGDFESVAFLGHGMRGAGGLFGFPAITDFGAGLEQAAGSADADASRKWMRQLSRYLDQVEIDSHQGRGPSN
jgi:HPt (histidine-containing phosphotransfer) domain-containing protein